MHKHKTKQRNIQAIAANFESWYKCETVELCCNRARLQLHSSQKKQALSSERAHKQVLKVEENMHLITNSSTGRLVTVANSAAPDGGFHRESMCLQTKPAHIPHRKIAVLACAIQTKVAMLWLCCAQVVRPSRLRHRCRP